MDLVFGYFHTSEVVLSKLYTIRFLIKSNIVFVITIMVLVTFLFFLFFFLYFRCTLVHWFMNFIYLAKILSIIWLRWEAAIGAFVLLLKRAQEYYFSRKFLTIFLVVLVNFGLTYCFLGS